MRNISHTKYLPSSLPSEEQVDGAAVSGRQKTKTWSRARSTVSPRAAISSSARTISMTAESGGKGTSAMRAPVTADGGCR